MSFSVSLLKLYSQEYWVLGDGNTYNYTNGGSKTVSYWNFPPYINEYFFEDSDYLNGIFGRSNFQNYDSSGVLLHFDTVTWEGNKWCGNNDQGSWFPEIVGEYGHFATDDYCWGQLRTKTNLSANQVVAFQVRPSLGSGGVNEDIAYFVFGEGWHDVSYNTYRDFIGIAFRNGSVYTSYPGCYQVCDEIGTYVPGEWITVELSLDANGALTVNSSNFTYVYQSSFTSASYKFIIAQKDSSDGFDVQSVTVQ